MYIRFKSYVQYKYLGLEQVSSTDSVWLIWVCFLQNSFLMISIPLVLSWEDFWQCYIDFINNSLHSFKYDHRASDKHTSVY